MLNNHNFILSIYRTQPCRLIVKCTTLQTHNFSICVYIIMLCALHKKISTNLKIDEYLF